MSRPGPPPHIRRRRLMLAGGVVVVALLAAAAVAADDPQGPPAPAPSPGGPAYRPTPVSEPRAARLPAAAYIDAPLIRQRLRNNCEATALSILLRTVGRRVDQLRIQGALARSGPLDPEGVGPDRIWGDPERGFVGRPEGGGVAGGFGVYPGPVRRTARRFGVELSELTGSRPSAVYRALRQRRAVMVWVGLADGPLDRWLSPDGRRVKVNFSEHTVVLHGISANGELVVSNPLRGTRERWSRAGFEQRWDRLGRRALAAPPARQALE